MYGRAYWIFLSRGRSTPAMRAMRYPCRCLCLGLRLQMTRITPRRLITLQCSQIGLTLVRTFKRAAPGKKSNGIVNYRRARKFSQGARLRGTPQLGEPPFVPSFPKPQEDRFAPHVRRSRDHVAALQLGVAPPRLHFANRADRERALDSAPQVPPQQLHRLCAVDGRGRVGARDLEHHASTLAHNRLRVVPEPRLARALGRFGERALRHRPARDGGAHQERESEQPGSHRLSTNRWYTRTGSAARVIGRPTTR